MVILLLISYLVSQKLQAILMTEDKRKQQMLIFQDFLKSVNKTLEKID
jgi:hypothetical protein